GEFQLSPISARLYRGPHRRRVHAAAALLPGRAGHRLRAPRAPLRARRATLRVDRLHDHAWTSRLRTSLRDGYPHLADPRDIATSNTGHADRDSHPRRVDRVLYVSGWHARGHLD